MCGIIYAKNFDGSPVNNFLLGRYSSQRNRGIEGFGMFDNDFGNLVRHTKEQPILKYIKKHPSSDILFHHRLPTSTINIKNACHPFSTGDKFKTTYILIHNGWINNAYRLADEHYLAGIDYVSTQADGSFNDSESLLWDFARYMEGKQPTMRASGAVAFICLALNERKGNKLYFFHNYQAPLKMTLNEDGIYLASEGQGEEVPENYLFSFDYETKLLTFKQLSLTNYDWKDDRPNTHFGSVGALYDKDRFEYETDADEDNELKYLDKDGRIIRESELDTNELEAERMITEYSHPMARSALVKLWPDDAPLKFQKSVLRYYNRIILDKNGDYDDALIAMEAYQGVIERKIKEVKRAKTLLKYQHQLQTCKIAQEVLLLHPFFNSQNTKDPSFILSDEQLKLA